MKSPLICAAIAVSVIANIQSAHAEVNVGDSFPEFKMTGSDGKSYSSEGLVGKQAFVIAWFPKAFTGGCTKECKSFRANGEAIRKFDVAYFTASVDGVKKNMDFAASLDLDYPILSDPEKTLAKELG